MTHSDFYKGFRYIALSLLLVSLLLTLRGEMFGALVAWFASSLLWIKAMNIELMRVVDDE